MNTKASELCKTAKKGCGKYVYSIGIHFSILVSVHLIKLQGGHVSDIRVDKIISLNSLVLNHPRRGNAGHLSHLRHWSCSTRTLNGTRIPQVWRPKAPNSILTTSFRILKLLQLNHLVLCIPCHCNRHFIMLIHQISK